MKSPEGIQFLDLRVTHIEQGFEDIRKTLHHTNERVDQIYEHLVGKQQNSSAQRTSWRQWGGATVLSLLALVIALWDRLAAATPS